MWSWWVLVRSPGLLSSKVSLPCLPLKLNIWQLSRQARRSNRCAISCMNLVFPFLVPPLCSLTINLRFLWPRNQNTMAGWSNWIFATTGFEYILLSYIKLCTPSVVASVWISNKILPHLIPALSSALSRPALPGLLRVRGSKGMSAMGYVDTNRGYIVLEHFSEHWEMSLRQLALFAKGSAWVWLDVTLCPLHEFGTC